MKKSIFLALLGISTSTFAQETLVNQGFESETNSFPVTWEKNGVILLDSDHPKAGKSAVLITEKDSELITERLIYPGRVDFWYMSPAYGEDYTFVVESSKDKKEWKEVAVIEQKFNEAMGNQQSYKLKSVKLHDADIKYLRWRIKDFINGSLFIDEIVVYKLGEAEMEAIKKKQQEVDLANRISEQVKQQAAQMAIKDARATVDQIEKKYLEKLLIIKNLAKQTSGIIGVTETGVFVFERSRMANPQGYKEFGNWLVSLERLSDPVMKNYLDDLKKQFDKFMKKDSKVAQVSKGIYDVGNIITGGKLEGIINSFKSIFANCYSKANLEAIFPVFGLDKKGQLVQNQENIDKVSKLMGEGKAEYDKVRAFFEIIESENAIISTIINQWKDVSKETQNYEQSLMDFLKNYLELVDVSINETIVTGLIQNNKTVIDECQKNMHNYFVSKLAVKDGFTGFTEAQQERLQLLSKNLLKVEELIESYYKTAGNFLSLYRLFENDLKRENPFVLYNQTNNTSYFQDAIATWNSIRTSASDKIGNISKRIESDYVKYDVRNHY